MNKLTHQYKTWIFYAIGKMRKDPAQRISYTNVIPNMLPDKAFSFMQWAQADGWLHSDGFIVYETKRTKCLARAEVLHELNERYKDK